MRRLERDSAGEIVRGIDVEKDDRLGRLTSSTCKEQEVIILRDILRRTTTFGKGVRKQIKLPSLISIVAAIIENNKNLLWQKVLDLERLRRNSSTEMVLLKKCQQNGGKTVNKGNSEKPEQNNTT